jgi:hypothetical protein
MLRPTGCGNPILQRPAAACLFNATANDIGAPVAIENTGGLPALADALAYAQVCSARGGATPWPQHAHTHTGRRPFRNWIWDWNWPPHTTLGCTGRSRRRAGSDSRWCVRSRSLVASQTDEHAEIVASAGGVLLNCAATKGMSHTIMESQPDTLDALCACIKPVEWVPQVANAIGALMNLTAESDVAVAAMLATPERMTLLFSVLPDMRDEAAVCCHVCPNHPSNHCEGCSPTVCVCLVLAAPSLTNIACARVSYDFVQVAGTIANLVFEDEGRQMLVDAKGVQLVVETLESSEDDAQSCACCVALVRCRCDRTRELQSPRRCSRERTLALLLLLLLLLLLTVRHLRSAHPSACEPSALAQLNACHQHSRSREILLDCGGVNALVTCLASENTDVKAAAAGALLNASASPGCAEAIRDAATEMEVRGEKTAVAGFELLLRCLLADQPIVRARAAGALFNCAAFGPDTRLAMLEAGVLKGVAASLVSAGTSDTLGAPKGCPKELAYRIQANLIGCVLNAALNPTCKVRDRSIEHGRA